MNFRSLSVRLVGWYAGLLTLVFVLLGALTLVLLRHYLEAALLDSQARRARQIADTLLAAVDRTGEAAVRQELEALYAPEANDRFIRITRADGSVLFVSGAPHDRSFDPARVPALSQVPGPDATARRVRLPGGDLLEAAVAYVPAHSAPYVVEVGIASHGTDATVQQVLVLLAWALALAVAVAVAGGVVLVRRSLRPVVHMALKAEEITQHKLGERLPVLDSGDELEDLSHALNKMLSRLEEAVQASKRFVADASHELRTPLAVLRGELESLAQDPQLRAATRESLGSLLEEVDRLADIVEGLLALSRLDAGEGKSEWVRFDLAELAMTTAEQMALLAEDKQIRVICKAERDSFVEGDRARIKQVIVNLLDNAIKYTPREGQVHLRVAREGEHAVLEVEDSGIGIPGEALAHVFERFYRVDDSRSREQGGAGLGLSIVKSICSAHDAQIDLTSKPSQGSRFRIRFLIAPSTVSQATP